MEVHYHFRCTLTSWLMCHRESYDKKQMKQGALHNISFECIFFEKNTV